ncbi:MAG: chemotaxis protein CheX [Planctomycetes bacterium]|nr:chemotaxis protein CheX [Planctomycetota bacterium]
MTELTSNALSIQHSLLQAVIAGTNQGLEMAAVAPTSVGASRLTQTRREISVMVGLVGDSNGTLTVNMSQRAMLYLASKLLFEEQESISEENVDAICEVGNMIAGCTKEALQDTDYRLTNISVPSLIFGANYNVHFTRGIDSCTVEFELPDMPYAFYDDRIFTTTISLLRRIA